jgi:signal transduction histidine kinase
VLFAFLSRTVDDIDEPCSRGELLACAHRLFLAVTLIQQATVTHYLKLVKQRLNEREQRLRGFNRALSHELKNLIGTIGGAADILELENVTSEEQKRMSAIIVRNAAEMRATLDNLVELSRLEQDARQARHVALPEAAAEVVRQLREAARAKHVELRVGPDLPRVEVSAAAVELCLSNLVANAIKYSDPAKEKRWVDVIAHMTKDKFGNPRETVIQVRDNGVGVPPEMRPRLFERFFRAHEASLQNIEGTGLGLSIVRDTAESLGGRAWAEFTENGSIFSFSIPTRRLGQDKPAASAPAGRSEEGSGPRS